MEIKNCIFKFRCTRTWDSLSPTATDAVRYCDDCDRGVHLCETNEQLIIALHADRCVAIPADLQLYSDSRDTYMVGRVLSE